MQEKEMFLKTWERETATTAKILKQLPADKADFTPTKEKTKSAKGLAEIFVKAGGIFSTPTCGPCLGGHMGVLTEGETALATTNRNFIGRMGSPQSFVYLSNPAVAAASAVTGRITHPGEIVKK